MRKQIKRVAAVVFAALFTVGSVFSSPAAPVASAEEQEEGVGVHAKIETFEKNFELTMEQKIYAIDEINRAVSIVTDSDMSDLEKYYRLALWLNDRATYDSEFWSGRYYMEYYRHQWDSYGVLTDKSVCAGIAITYAALCHAAGLPCKFVRLDPAKGLDHTINYIPNINGNAYYVDVTEGDFIQSDECSAFARSVDKGFAYITKDCTNHSFEYRDWLDRYYDEPEAENEKNKDKDKDTSIKKEIIKEKEEQEEQEEQEEYKDYQLCTLGIKGCFRTTYHDWFKEYALHQDTDKDFFEDYVEKGSGQRGVHYAKYEDYPKQFSATEKPGIWFLEDFYRDPKAVEAALRGNVLNKEIFNTEGLREIYDCKDEKELIETVKYDMSAQIFPSYDSETGKIVPEEKWLGPDTDFVVSCDSFDKSQQKAMITIKGIGEYSGSFTIPVKLKKANPMKVSGKTATIKYSDVKKKAQTIKRAKAISVSNAKGAVNYAFVSAKKDEKDFKKYFNIKSATGDVVVAKGLKKGTYKVKAKVSADGTKTYGSSGQKSVTIKVVVK